MRLSANENPYGPSPKAFQAITDSFGLACRYPDEHNNVLIDKLAKLNGVNHDQILLGDGSGEILVWLTNPDWLLGTLLGLCASNEIASVACRLFCFLLQLRACRRPGRLSLSLPRRS